MSDEAPIESAESAVPAKNVERLFPFVVKTRGLLVGRDTMRANRLSGVSSDDGASGEEPALFTRTSTFPKAA